MKKQILPLLITLLGISSTVNAQVGINMTAPHAPLQFKNETVNRKIVLYETTNDDNQFYGFGVNPGILRYQADVTTTDHAFFAGTSATTSNELMRIKGTGNVGIGTSAPVAKLDIVGTTFGIKNSQTSGSWDNLWFNVTSSIPSINASGAELGLQFNVGSNSVGTYGDGQTLTTVSTMLANGNMGVGTTTPNHRLDLGTSLGSSITDIGGKKLAVYDAAAGGDFYGLGISAGTLQLHAASTVAEAPGMVLTGGGSVGIGTAANSPTNTLDVAGTTRVRTITPVTGATVVTPVYSDANGVLVKASPSGTFGGTTSNSVTVASGATGTLITGVTEGAYKATMIVGDGCVYYTVADFFVNNFSFNGSFAIRGVSGLLSPSTTKGPTFSETSQTITVVTWTGKPTCQDGGNSTALNYTLTMPSAGTINVINNGNVTRAYKIILTRID